MITILGGCDVVYLLRLPSDMNVEAAGSPKRR
jgi:hypothetical protein